jgi:hypothetical protein
VEYSVHREVAEIALLLIVVMCASVQNVQILDRICS